MKILVTGGLGFIGSYFAEKLAEKADKILILDNLSGHSKSGMETLEKLENVFIYDKDIREDTSYIGDGRYLNLRVYSEHDHEKRGEDDVNNW